MIFPGSLLDNDMLPKQKSAETVQAKHLLYQVSTERKMSDCSLLHGHECVIQYYVVDRYAMMIDDENI